MIEKILNWLFEKFQEKGMATEDNVENYVRDQIDDYDNELFDRYVDSDDFDNLQYDFEQLESKVENLWDELDNLMSKYRSFESNIEELTLWHNKLRDLVEKYHPKDENVVTVNIVKTDSKENDDIINKDIFDQESFDYRIKKIHENLSKASAHLDYVRKTFQKINKQI